MHGHCAVLAQDPPRTIHWCASLRQGADLTPGGFTFDPIPPLVAQAPHNIDCCPQDQMHMVGLQE